VQRAVFVALAFLGLALSAAACAHLSVVVGPTAPPSASPTPTGSPGTCNDQAANTTVIIAMALAVAPTTDPTYGVINGYTTVDITTGTFSNVASVITAHTSDVVQFANAETGATPILHSAVNFPNASAFPATPYTFPASTQQPLGTQISQSQWSTGPIQSTSGTGVCFSQAFTISAPGTYRFGDLSYYNLSNMRDVLVVSP
jgi:hypothetical protein